MSQYRLGTVSLTSGSNIVTLAGGDATQLEGGDWFYVLDLTVNDPPVRYVIASTPSQTDQFALTVNWPGASVADRVYVVHRDFSLTGLPIWSGGEAVSAQLLNELVEAIEAGGGGGGGGGGGNFQTDQGGFSFAGNALKVAAVNAAASSLEPVDHRFLIGALAELAPTTLAGRLVHYSAVSGSFNASDDVVSQANDISGANAHATADTVGPLLVGEAGRASYGLNFSRDADATDRLMVATVSAPTNALFMFIVARVDQNHAVSSTIIKTAHSAGVDTQTAGDIELAAASSGSTLNLRISTSAGMGQLISLGPYKNGAPFVLAIRISSGTVDAWCHGQGHAAPVKISAAYSHGSGFDTNRIRFGRTGVLQNAFVIHEFLIASTLPTVDPAMQQLVLWAANRYFVSPLTANEADPVLTAPVRTLGHPIIGARRPVIWTDGDELLKFFPPLELLPISGTLTSEDDWSGANLIYHSNESPLSLTLSASHRRGWNIVILVTGAIGVNLALASGAENVNGFPLTSLARIRLEVVANLDNASAEYVGYVEGGGALSSLDTLNGDRFNWGVLALDATAGNVTFDGTDPQGILWVTGHSVERGLTITPVPSVARILLVYNDGSADLGVFDQSVDELAVLPPGVLQVFTFDGVDTWTAQFVWPGQGVGGGGGITAFAEDVAPVDVGDGGTLTAASHGEFYISGSTLHRRKVRLRHASNQASTVTVTVADGLNQQIACTVASDQTGVVTIQRQTSATINGATSVALGSTTRSPAGNSILIIPGPTNVYHLEGQTAEPVSVELKNYSETSQTVSSSGGAATINLANGNAVETTLTENITSLTLSGAVTGKLYQFVWKVTQGSPARSITWPASVSWAGASPPTLSSGSGDVDILAFMTWNGGTAWRGFVGGQDFG